MLLSAKPLKNVMNINSWQYCNAWMVSSGQPFDLYFQLVDLEKDTAISPKGGFTDTNIRYIPQGTTSAQVVFDALDDDEVITVNASQPFADDKSIWKISLLSTQVPNSGNVKVIVTEAGVVKSFIMKQAVSVISTSC